MHFAASGQQIRPDSKGPMPGTTMAASASHFVTRSMSDYRTRAEERSWRRAAYQRRSNQSWEWTVGAVLLVGIAFTGYGWVQTRQHLGTTQSELETAGLDAAQVKAKAAEVAGSFASLNSELEKANSERNELQTKLDRATSEAELAQSQLKDKQSSRNAKRT